MAISPYDRSLQVLPPLPPDQERLARAVEAQVDADLQAAAQLGQLWGHVRPDTDELRAGLGGTLTVGEGSPDDPGYRVRDVRAGELTESMRQWLCLRYVQAGWRSMELDDNPDGTVDMQLWS